MKILQWPIVIACNVKQKFYIEIQIRGSFRMLADAPLGPPQTWAPRNLAYLGTWARCFSGDPNYNVVFYWSSKVLPVCWGFN